MLWIALGIPFVIHGDVESEFVPPPAREFELLWGDSTGITWGGNTIIDYPVIA